MRDLDHRRPGFIGAVGFAAAVAAAGCSADDHATPDAAAPAPASHTSSLGSGATVAHTESRFGVPTFVWTHPAGARPGSRSGRGRPIETARAAIAEHAALYHLDDTDVSRAVVAGVHDRGAGPVLVSFRAEAGGIEILGEKLSVVMDHDLQPIALSGQLSSSVGRREPDAAWPGAPADGAAVALRELAGKAIASSQVIAAGARDGYEYFRVSPSAGVALEEPVRARKVYFHAPEGLVPAYYVEVEARTGAPAPDLIDLDGKPVPTREAYSFVIAARTGDVLLRKNLVAADAYTYRVWADPVTGIPFDSPAGNGALPKATPTPDGAQASFVGPSDVTLSSFPFSRGDPWLPANAGETIGNNAEAYLNLLAPDGFGDPTTTQPADPATADYRAQATAPAQFLHRQVLDSNVALAEGRQGSIQQLFYDLNFLHDWFYDAGFDEAAGNAQADNFGRGGIAGDSIEGQVQDFSAFRSSSMVTPADGGRPRMRMHLFPSPANNLEVLAPAAVAGKRPLGVSLLGPQIVNLTANIVQATFAPGPACTVTNAAALAGTIALFDLDDTPGTGCDFAARFAQLRTTAAAALLVVASQTSSNPVDMTGYLPGVAMPVVSISAGAASGIKTRLAAGTPVNARLFRAADRDGALDAQLVTHEFFHYVSNRLVGNGAGLAANQAAGLGEGWSDFAALLLTARPDDIAVPGNATWSGVYAFATFTSSGVPFNGSANQGYYFGPRRYPYSTNSNRNPLFMQHMENNLPLPFGPPVAFGADGANNAEIHNTGEVWATMLWECYAGLLRDTLGAAPRLTFQQAQDRMKRYLIAALKITPLLPTITEARDALLAVALASDVADYVVFRLAFGKRGAGRFATAPSRLSTTNANTFNDFYAGPELRLESATLDDSAGSCDHDGVLDHGEYGLFTITLRNVGTTTLTATTATISELDLSTADRWFPNGNVVSFPPTAPNQTTTASLVVALTRTVSGTRTLQFDLGVRDPGITDLNGLVQISRVGFRINTDELPATSATDDVAAVSTPMTTGFAPEFGNVAPWHRIAASPLFRQWNMSSPGAASDQYLVSPVMTMAVDEFTLALSTSWAFHSDANGNDDGGVIELSVNGGPFIDFGATAYNGVISDYPGDVNPLRGRAGFVGTGSPFFVTLRRTVGAGNTVQVRYRAASDIALSRGGWSISRASYIGVVETPFATVVADSDACTQVPVSADLRITVDDGVAAATRGGSVTYRIVASNDGPDAIIGAVVNDTFPAGLSCTWTCTASPGAACTASGSGNLADRITLPVGGTATYTVPCTVPVTLGGTTLTNTATIALPGPVTDPSTANNAATDTDQLLRPAAHLTAQKTVSGSFSNGGTVRYSIVLSNDGPGAQPDLAGDELTDVLPSSLVLVTASATAGTVVVNRTDNTVIWNGQIAAGAEVTITVFAVINAPAGTRISNQATFQYDSDGDDSNDATGTSDAVQCPRN